MIKITDFTMNSADVNEYILLLAQDYQAHADLSDFEALFLALLDVNLGSIAESVRDY